MWESKTYSQVKIALGAANFFLASLLIYISYFFIISSSDKSALQTIFTNFKTDPVLALISIPPVVSALWAYLATELFRLHDRLYEPHLSKWRASYDTDFILRSLCYDYNTRLSQKTFERAYAESTLRNKMMTRLFYILVGDFKDTHAGLLARFYTTIRNYWVLVLGELYMFFAAIFFLGYAIFNSQSRESSFVILILLLLALILRVWSKTFIDEARLITSEQISTILREHKKEFEKNIKQLMEEEGLGH